MKKVLVSAAVLLVAVVTVRRFGPALGKRAMRRCHDMFDRMPEDFPPKRMMNGIEEIREQNSRILRHLEEAALMHTSEGR